MTLGRRRVPVVMQADVVVAGASMGGCALALSAARSGLNVVLVEPRTYPGYELSALYRPWLEERALEYPPAILKPWLAAASRQAPGGELALHPDAMKRGLEDVLLKAGVRLLYSSQPVGVIRARERPAGIVIGNKGGRQAVLAGAIVDATEWGLVGRLAGEEFVLRRDVPRRIRARRTIEFTGVDTEAGGVPAHWLVHQGYLGPGHVLVEMQMELDLASADLGGLMGIEIEARRRTIEFVENTRENVPAFRNSYFAHASYEARMASPFMLARRRHENVFVLGSASAVCEEEAAERLLEPLEAIRTGQTLAPAVRRAARKRRTRSAYRSVEVPAQHVSMLAAADVLVAGGGTSGAVAAPVAAAGGANTVLLEMNSGLGGTGTLGGVNTYWYGKKNGFTAEVDRRYLKVARRVGATREETDHLARIPDSGLWHVEAKMQGLLDWSVESGARVLFRTFAVGALVKGKRVEGVLVATPDGLAAIRARVTIEATGDGDVAAFAGATTSYGARRDRMPMYSSLGPVRTPGHPTNSFATWVDIADVNDYTRFILAGRRRFMGHDHGPYVAPRESRHVKGSYTVTLQDQLTFKRHPDVICLCNDGRDIKGLTCADWAVWGLSCGKIDVEIPYRAVVPEKLDGILIAGKAYSVTHEGLALARMQSDMQNLGGALAVAALECLRLRVQPRNLDVKRLQRELVRCRHLPRAVLRRRTGEGSVSVEEAGRMVRGLKGNELHYEPDAWKDRQRRPQTVALICAAGRAAIPHLEKAYAAASGDKRLLLARLLAWYGSRAGVDALLERINSDLSDGKLPRLRKSRKWRHMPPDNASMTTTCRLIYALGLTRDPRALKVLGRVVSLIRARPDEFRDDGNSLFYYVQMTCLAAEMLGNSGAVPILKRLHAKPGLHGLKARGFQADIMDERMGYLEVAIACALARCGSPKGIRILASYLDDSRACLARHAHGELVRLAGRDQGRTASGWLKWLKKKGRGLKPRPVRERSE